MFRHLDDMYLIMFFYSCFVTNPLVAFLPSTFAMYTTMLFFSQMLQPPRQHSAKRTFWAIFWVGLGGLLGWPFSAAVGLPFALEELLIHSRNQSKKKTVRFRDWRRIRFLRLVTSAIAVLACVLVRKGFLDEVHFTVHVKEREISSYIRGPFSLRGLGRKSTHSSNPVLFG